MEAGAIAHFEGITAWGDQFRGAGWHLVDLTGWTESPDVDLEMLARPGTHGVFSLPGYMRERKVGLSGFHVAANHTLLEHASAELRGLQSRDIRLTIEDSHGTWSVNGKVTRAVYRPHGFAPEGTWELEVTCPLPWKYGETHPFPGGSPAVTWGTQESSPVLTVTGTSASGYTITGPGGRRVVTSKALTAGAPHTIDLAKGGLYIGGARQLRALTVFEPWLIPTRPPGVVATVNNGLTLLTRVTDIDL